MIRDVWDWLHRQFLGQSPIGTPENPEILDPGQTAHAARLKRRPFARLRLFFTLLSAMVVVSAPAVFTVWACAWLIDMGTNAEGAAFAWLLLILFAPMTLVFTAAAIVIDLFLLFAMFATLSGRRMIVMNFGSSAQQPGPRPRAARPVRTVHEPSFTELSPPAEP
jgi:hypothetical protein